MSSRRYGRIPDRADYRDHFLPRRATAAPLPLVADYRPFCGPIKDQGNEGSCTGHAGTATAEWQFRKYKKEAPILSPQNLYVNNLIREDTFPIDGGAMSRTICQVLNAQGVCEENCEPYVAGSLQKPNETQLQNALKYQLGGYHRLAGLQDFLSVLGDPTPWTVLIGFTVYQSFESEEIANTGFMSVPKPKEIILGGHEVHAVGYDMNKQHAIIQNSWGSSWGDKGFFYMPFEVLNNPDIVSDLWIIHLGHWGKDSRISSSETVPATVTVPAVVDGAAIGHGG